MPSDAKRAMEREKRAAECIAGDGPRVCASESLRRNNAACDRVARKATECRGIQVHWRVGNENAWCNAEAMQKMCNAEMQRKKERRRINQPSPYGDLNSMI
jgi:hypothetical protein